MSIYFPCFMSVLWNCHSSNDRYPRFLCYQGNVQGSVPQRVPNRGISSRKVHLTGILWTGRREYHLCSFVMFTSTRLIFLHSTSLSIWRNNSVYFFYLNLDQALMCVCCYSGFGIALIFFMRYCLWYWCLHIAEPYFSSWTMLTE